MFILEPISQNIVKNLAHIPLSEGTFDNNAVVFIDFKFNRAIVKQLRAFPATHLLEQGTNIRIIQELLGYESIQTTEIYTHIANNDLQDVVNPVDNLFENSD